MKKINDKQKYQDLLQLFVAQDVSRKDSLLRTILVNKIINYLFINLPQDKRPEMLRILNRGINEEFLVFMSENLTEEDIKKIAEVAQEEFAQVFNYALVSNTDGK